MMRKKSEKAEVKVKSIKSRNQEIELLSEKMKDLDARSRRDNLIDGLKEIENETWEKTKGILQQMICDVLEVEGINIKRAHKVHRTGNKNNKRNTPITVVPKLSIYKCRLLKQNIGDQKRKLADCKKVNKSVHVCLFGTVLLQKRSSASNKISSYSHYVSFLYKYSFFIKNLFMKFEMYPLLRINNTSEQNFENKLFNPFDFQHIMNDQNNDPHLFFVMINPNLLVFLITLLINFDSPLLVF